MSAMVLASFFLSADLSAGCVRRSAPSTPSATVDPWRPENIDHTMRSRSDNQNCTYGSTSLAT